MSYIRLDNPSIDKYLREAVGCVNPDGTIDTTTGISEVIRACATRLGVSKSTIDRWRKDDAINSSDAALTILIAINKIRPKERKCGLVDIAKLCNYRKQYRKKVERVDESDNI